MIKYTLNTNYVKEFESFLFNIQSFFSLNTQTIHKARNELKVIPIENITTVVKSFKIPNIINKIAYSYFRDSKAKKSYTYSLKIGNFTPTPIGYIEFYKYGLIDESYFISEEFKYDFTIREPLLETNFEHREEVFRAFARFTLELHNANIFHDDYSPGNILIQKDKEGYTFKIVDINRMKFIALNEDQRAQNFSKLWASDEILTIMTDEYVKHHTCSKSFTERTLYYSNKNKRIKNFKKRIKGQEVND